MLIHVLALACTLVSGLGLVACGGNGDEETVSESNSSVRTPIESDSASFSSEKEDSTEENVNVPSKGLAYALSEDCTCDSVNGIGACVDSEIVIPNT